MFLLCCVDESVNWKPYSIKSKQLCVSNRTSCSDEDLGSTGSCSRSSKIASLYHGTWPVEPILWSRDQEDIDNKLDNSEVTNNVSNEARIPESPTISQSYRSLWSLKYPASRVCRLTRRTNVTKRRKRGGRKRRRRMEIWTGYTICWKCWEGTKAARILTHSCFLWAVPLIFAWLWNSPVGFRPVIQYPVPNYLNICTLYYSGCLPLLIKLINARGEDLETKEITSQMLHNIIQATADKSTEQPETRIYNLLEQLRDYCQMLRSIPDTEHQTGAKYSLKLKNFHLKKYPHGTKLFQEMLTTSR